MVSLKSCAYLKSYFLNYIVNSLKDHSVENKIRSSGGLGLEYQSLDRGIIDTVSKICDISLSF